MDQPGEFVKAVAMRLCAAYRSSYVPQSFSEVLADLHTDGYDSDGEREAWTQWKKHHVEFERNIPTSFSAIPQNSEIFEIDLHQSFAFLRVFAPRLIPCREARIFSVWRQMDVGQGWLS
jgi:hypothetical protein